MSIPNEARETFNTDKLLDRVEDLIGQRIAWQDMSVIIDEIEAAKKELPRRQRLELEHDELERKIQSLRLFTMTDNFRQLSKHERDLLDMQSRHMHGYLSILAARISIA